MSPISTAPSLPHLSAPLRSPTPMARFLSQTLTLPPPSSILASRLLTLRRRSHRSDDPSPQLIEIDIDAEQDVPGIRRLEDAIHGIIVRRSQPDWLPFLPGTSYWVPPRRRRALGLIELAGKLAQPMGEEAAMSLTTPRGWPSLNYFVEGLLKLEMLINHQIGLILRLRLVRLHLSRAGFGL